MTQIQSFLVSSMVYWEAMSSFLVDQETEVLSHLDAFCSPTSPSTIYPHPWTGVGTPIFICLAKVGTLLRKKRVLRKLRLFKNGESHRKDLHSQLLEEAQCLEQDILKCRLPFVGLIEDVGDPHTTPSHLHGVARCYRFAALLELYRAFPEIVEADTILDLATDLTYEKANNQARLVLGLAFGILGILQAIPRDSHTISTQSLVLLIAGSALSHVSSNQVHETPSQAKLNLEVTHWRQFVRGQVLKLYTTIGLRPIKNVAVMLEEVWSRMDIAVNSGGSAGNQDNIFSDQVHWMDIMTQKRLETILG
ncbi:hypothetical protein QQZ08_009154 [Neonectria magnoliae]|uniref:Uncharacterized protein n=1 Tax=Neonectria magnoliae TaxID=2732573 RepID=A0ABR1HRA6_9HYPO